MRAAVIGSGPNGLAAAIRLAQAGLPVDVYESDAIAGGGASSAELTLPGFVHDLGSAIHPMALSSPFFRSLPLARHGLEWIHPPVPVAHPLDHGVVTLERDIPTTTRQFSADEAAYRRLLTSLVRAWPDLMHDVLRPLLSVPWRPLVLAKFGLTALQPAHALAGSLFRTEQARALFAGAAAHSFLRLEQPLSSSFGIMLMAAAHAVGWPIPKGGSQSIANALVGHLRELGGELHVSSPISSLAELGKRSVICCDVSPRQFIRLAGARLPQFYRRALERYRYGPGVFKVDWALREPIPWQAPVCRQAGTVHLGGTLEEIASSERAMFGDAPSPKPFVILAQPSLFDRTRAPEGGHTAWAYCHVPNGWAGSQLEAIESQIERFAPGFRDCVLARHAAKPANMQAWNSNLVGGDIMGGMSDLPQFVFRPTWRNYQTPIPGVFLCSASTPPGGGVHGMCGFNGAERALRWLHRQRRTNR